MQRVRGLFALVLLSADDPEKLVAVRNGPPIVVGHRRRRILRRLRRAGDPRATRATSCSSTTAKWPSSRAQGVTFTTLDGKTVATQADARHLGSRSRRRRPATSTSCSRRSSSSRTAVRETVLGRVSLDTGQVFLDEMAISDADLQGDRQGHAAGLRHVVARGARRQVHDRGARRSCRSKSTTAPSTATATRSSTSKTLAVAITQSGETADTLAALREAKGKGARSLAICNVVGSMATREAEGTIYTHAGPEIGVASTKAFTTQLVALYLFALQARPKCAARSSQARALRAHRRADAAAAGPRRHAEDGEGDRGDRRRSSTTARTSSISAAASTTRSPSKARSS